MTTTMSCSKRDQFAFLYRFALKKSLGWTAIYSVLLFLCYPLMAYKEARDISYLYNSDYEYRWAHLMDSHIFSAFLVSALLCVMVLVLSAVLNSYMHNKRSADFFHSMPVNRGVMLTANFFAGLTCLVVPIWVNSIIAMTAYPILTPQADIAHIVKILSLEMLAWTMGAFVLLAISTAVAVSVSTAVENVGYTVAALLEGSIILIIWDLSCSTAFETYLSIFDSSAFNTFLSELLYYLSPVFALGKVIVLLQEQLTSSLGFTTEGSVWLPLIIWFVLGIGILWLAVKLYEKRQSERAEQWGRQSKLGFAVKLLSAIIGAWLFGNIFGELLDLDTRFYYLFGAIVGAPMVYIVMEAITNKGFHNMKKCLPYLASAVGVCLLFSLYFAFDGFGYDKRIPQPESVKKVELEMFSLNEYVLYDDNYAMNYSGDVVHWNFEQNRVYEFNEEEAIELITEIHGDSVGVNGDGPVNGDYHGRMNASYDSGLLGFNRGVIVYGNEDNLVNLRYCDEYLNKYNPFFQMKASYLEFVQIQDKTGNLIGDGEIPKESFEALLEAVRADMMAATSEQLLDVDNNKEVAILYFDTKYPKEIYESTGELYHYDMTQNLVVRQQDVNTIKLLEDLGFELKVSEEYYERVLSIAVNEGYSGGDLPGEASYSGEGVGIDKHDYYLGENEITDKEQIRTVVDNMTCVYSGKGDQYRVTLYLDGLDGKSVHYYDAYISRDIVLQLMKESDSYYVPYVLDEDEQKLLGMIRQAGNIESTELYINWKEWSAISGDYQWISIKQYAEENCPAMLEGKSEFELKWMDATPYMDENGALYYLGF